MKWLILLLLLPFYAFAQKPDFVRTPNGPNTIVDWNVKFKTLIIPHGGTLGLFGSQDTVGHVRILVAGGDTSMYYYTGRVWRKLNGGTFVEVDPTVPVYAKSLTGFSIIKISTDAIYQPIGSYLTSEIDPTVSAYSKSLTSFSVVKASTDPLYQPIGNYYTQSQVNALLSGKQSTIIAGSAAQYLRGDLSLATFPTNVSSFTNDAGYLTGAHVTSFNTRIGAVVPESGDYSAFYYPLSGNPSSFLTSESDPTVPSYSKSLTSFSVVKASTDALYYPIPTGLTTQYVRGDGSLATSPTTVSSFTNDAGYLTNITGDARYPQLSGGYVNPSWITSLPYSKITGTPTFATLSNGYGVNSLSYNTVSSASVVVDTASIKSKASSLTDYNNLKTSIALKLNITDTTSAFANLAHRNTNNILTGLNTIQRTTEQLRIAYDASNYSNIVVASDGTPTISSNGVHPIILNNGVVTGSATSNFWSPSLTNSAFTNNSAYLFGGLTGINTRIGFRGSTSATPGTGTSYSSFIIGNQGVTIPASGTALWYTQQVIQPLTITAGSGIATNSSSLLLYGQASGASNNYNLFSYSPGSTTINAWFKYGKVRVSGLQIDSAAIAITPSQGNNSTQISTTAYVDGASGIISGMPTIVAGTGAGTSPNVSVTSNSHGLQVTVITGTLPAGTNAIIGTVTLANALSYTPYPVFSSGNAATSLLNGASMIYMSSSGASNVTITSGTTALVASTTYIWNIKL